MSGQTHIELSDALVEIELLGKRLLDYDSQWSQIADIIGGDAVDVPDPYEKTMAGRVEYEIERLKAVVDADWTRKLTMLVGQCIADQRNGHDVLASASWDAVVEYWTERENGN